MYTIFIMRHWFCLYAYTLIHSYRKNIKCKILSACMQADEQWVMNYIEMAPHKRDLQIHTSKKRLNYIVYVPNY